MGCRLTADQSAPGITEVWLREVDLATGRLTGDEHVLWNGALRGAIWAEGPHLYERDGWFYLSIELNTDGTDAGDVTVRTYDGEFYSNVSSVEISPMPG